MCAWKDDSRKRFQRFVELKLGQEGTLRHSNLDGRYIQIRLTFCIKFM